MSTSSDSSPPAALADWLARLEQRAPASRIALGLDRAGWVWQRMDLSLEMPVITVAGTNGKGSVVALLEAMLLAAGYRPFAYTSPHLHRFSERMRIDGREAEEHDIVDALEAVEAARGEVELTYFEHTTLAALYLACKARADVAILEVGLGGRLDAVNIVDADVAVITSIGIDHTEFLGATREEIAREKAGVARRERPVVVGEPEPPASLADALGSIGARAIAVDDALDPDERGRSIRLRHRDRFLQLPLPALEGAWQRSNAACALIALLELSDRLPVDEAAMAAGLRSARLAGRFETVRERPALIFDVAHNPAAAEALAGALGGWSGRSTAIFAALAGKDVAGIGRALDACFSDWLVAPLSGERARSAAEVADELGQAPVTGGVETVESVAAALEQALAVSEAFDRVVVFGSFLTVAEARTALASCPRKS